MSELERLLPRIAPPPGGERRLRAALRDAPHVRPATRWAGGVALAVSVALAVAVMPRTTPEEREVARALREALAPPSPDPVIEGGSAHELPSADPNVRVFLVQAG